ncbi:MAG: hypothetical protein IJI25_05620 [Eubacterium sp.]|nr:hypothetical protein [Eubacterium sp.]
MLIDGDIDLLGDVSYTMNRSKSILYSMNPMGAENYFLFVAAGGVFRRICSAAGYQKKASRLILWN